MDLFIKSFNRPYYLERCVKSIFKNLTGNYIIKILDDGTPSKYLDKLQKKYPELIISRSIESESKAKLIQNHAANGGELKFNSIPVRFWKNSIKETKNECFILLEDDMWLTKPLSVDHLESFMRKDKFISIKLFSFKHSKKVNWEKSAKIDNTLEETFTKLQNKRINISLFKFLLQNRFYSLSILDKLRLNNYKWLLPAYSLYTVAGVVFNTKYWLYLWQNDLDKVNESIQLINALDWLEKNPDSRYGKISDAIQTSFLTSATNTYKDVNLDIFAFNHCLNENWYEDKLECMQNYPLDFEINYLANFLESSSDRRCEKGEWFKWIDKFKNQYRSFGFEIN